MRLQPTYKHRSALIFAFATFLAIPLWAQEIPATKQSPNAEDSVSSHDLHELLLEVLLAGKTSNEERMVALLKGMEIPNYSTWFVETFGRDVGERLAASYAAYAPDRLVTGDFMRFAKYMNDQIILRIKEVPEPDEDPAFTLIRGLLKRSTVFYSVVWKISTNVPDHRESSSHLGYFVFVDGAYRRLSSDFLCSLSSLEISRLKVCTMGKLVEAINSITDSDRITTNTATRIRVSGNVEQLQVLQMVQPEYPPLARNAHISGTVILHAILAKDGTVQELQFVSGPPLLMKSALDAVKQWRYRQTLLNGQPVEVDTTISVVFALNP